MNGKPRFAATEIQRGVALYQTTPGACLLDVRTPEEYAEGHIPGSINFPLARIQAGDAPVDDPDTPLFVYCRSGNRSRMASEILTDMGFDEVRNIGGILSWHGELAK